MKKWRTLVALLLLVLAVIFEWNWFWALFILVGLLHTIKSKKIHFVEEVSLNENPKLYWIMVIIWSLLALYSMNTYLGILT